MERTFDALVREQGGNIDLMLVFDAIGIEVGTLAVTEACSLTYDPEIRVLTMQAPINDSGTDSLEMRFHINETEEIDSITIVDAGNHGLTFTLTAIQQNSHVLADQANGGIAPQGGEGGSSGGFGRKFLSAIMVIYSFVKRSRGSG